MGLIVAAVTAIAGVVSSAGAAVTTFAGTALGGLVVKAVAYVGLNLLSGLLAKRQGDDEPTGVQLNLQLGADEYRSVTFGEVARAGHLTFFNSYGDNRKYLQLVFDLSSSHCQGLNSVIVDGQEKSLTSIATVSNEDARYHVADFSDKIKIAFYSGANGQGINQELVDNSGGRWSSTDKKTGVCYVYVLLEWDDDYFERRPEFIFVFNGTLCYDWRKDSTNGGSGSHRWGDPSTYEFTENPYVHLYNAWRGVYTGGATATDQGTHIVGLNFVAADIHHTYFTTAANICDESVNLDAGGTEPRYRGSFILYDGDLDSFNLAVMKATAGHMVEVVGKLGVVAGAAQSTVKTITDADLVNGKEVVFSEYIELDRRVNGVYGSFVDRENLWEPNSYQSLTSTTYETEDGEKLSRRLDLLGVSYHTQARRLAKARLLETRYQAHGTIPLGYEHIDLKAGQWISWQSDHYGWTKTFRIVRSDIDPEELLVEAQIDEISSVVFAWTTSEEGTLPASGTVGGFGDWNGAINNFTVTRVHPGNKLRFAYDAIDDPTVVRIDFQIREKNTVQPMGYSDPDPSDGETVWFGAEPGQAYEVRAKIATDPVRATSWTAWTEVIVDDPVIVPNWLKNGKFKTGTAELIDSNDKEIIPHWYFESGWATGGLSTKVLQATNLEIVGIGGTVPPGNDYVIRIEKAAGDRETIMWSEYDPDLAAAEGRGMPVEPEDQVTTHAYWVSDSGVRTIRYELWVVPEGGGTAVAQENKLTGATFAEFNILDGDWNDAIGTFSTVRWRISTKGTAFWRISANTNGYSYGCDFEMIRQQGHRLIGEQQIVEPAYVFTAAGADDVTFTGLSNYSVVESVSITATLPDQEKFIGKATANMVLVIGASETVDIRIDIGGQAGYSADETGNPRITRNGFIELTGTGEEETYTAELRMSGDNGVDLTQRDLALEIIKK